MSVPGVLDMLAGTAPGYTPASGRVLLYPNSSDGFWHQINSSGVDTALVGVAGITAADASAVIGGTATNPTVRTNTLDVVAAQHPAAADWSNNSHKITSLSNGTAATDAAAFGQIPTVGGLGTPDSANVTLTASTQVVVSGTSFQLATGYLAVGQRYRFTIGIEKTSAAGTATWTAKLCFGTAGTNADAAIATWTSGTNTAAIDQALLIIEARITALGSGTSATAACTAFYVNTLTNATGLGIINPVPSPTAGFNSTATTPFMHVDITMGASAACTGVGMAEQVK